MVVLIVEDDTSIVELLKYNLKPKAMMFWQPMGKRR